MPNLRSQAKRFDHLVDWALENGAHRASIISPSIICVEERVQMKCLIPRCTSYGKSLTCPPNLPGPAEVAQMVSEYEVALMLQVVGDEETDGAEPGMGDDYNWVYPSVYRLHEILHHLERTAMDMGCYLAMGLGGGDCRWCEMLREGEADDCKLHASAGGCPGADTGKCVRDYRARPALEGMSINVIKTADNAGMPFEFTGKTEGYVTWNGIVLLE